MLIRELDGWNSAARSPDGIGGALTADQAAGLIRTSAAPVDNGSAAPQNHEIDDEPPADDGPAQNDQLRDGASEDAAADDDQPPGEKTTEDADPADDDQPPIEPPRSWTKAEKEAFAALPREHQETLIERERAREKDIRKRQDDVVAVAKAVQAKEQAAEQARVQYEDGIKRLSEQANAFLANEFSDIKTWEDVHKMAAEDPVRHNRWQTARAQAQAIEAERQRLALESQKKAADEFQAYDREETAKFLERAPEFADPKQAPQLSAEINAMLADDYGVSQQELAALWAGAQVSVLDHRFRLIIRDALAYKKAKANLKPKPAPKPASPPPQRPGVPPAKGEAANASLEKANMQLTRTGSIDDAVRLLRLKKSA